MINRHRRDAPREKVKREECSIWVLPMIFFDKRGLVRGLFETGTCNIPVHVQFDLTSAVDHCRLVNSLTLLRVTFSSTKLPHVKLISLSMK